MEWDWNLLPSDRMLLKEAAAISAESLGRCLVPYWQQTERLYYAGGCVEMRDASVYIKEGDWQGAYDLWLSVFEGRKSEKMKAHAALNLAVAAEMLDRLGEAEQWLDKAKRYVGEGSEEEMVWKYSSARLAERMKNYSHLKVQMGRFGNNL